MNTLLVLASVAMGTFVVVIVLATIGRKSIADRREAHYAAVLEEVRPAVFRLVATDGEDREALRAELRRRTTRVDRALRRRAVNALMNRYAENLRGEIVDDIRSFLIGQGFSADAAADLRSRSSWKRALAVQELGFLVDPAYHDRVAARLQDRDAAVRIATARALGRYGDPEAVPSLLAARDDRRDVPYGPVSLALLQIGMPGVPALREGLEHPSFRVRRLAVDVLGQLGVVGIDGDLVRLLRSDRDTLVRVRAAHALGRVGTDEVLGELYDSLRHENADIRGSIVRAVASIGARGSLPVLRRALDDPDHFTARAAARALVEMGAPGEAILRARAAASGAGAMYAIEALDLEGGVTDEQRERVRAWGGSVAADEPTVAS